VRYLETGQIIYINETQVGQGMVRDYELLEAAVMRPHQTVMGQDAYPTIHDKAAALTHSLIKNHPFMDPNKRTALLADIAFYGLNGYIFRAPEPGHHPLHRGYRERLAHEYRGYCRAA
jgi:death on curing protein